MLYYFLFANFNKSTTNATVCIQINTIITDNIFDILWILVPISDCERFLFCISLPIFSAKVEFVIPIKMRNNKTLKIIFFIFLIKIKLQL